MTMHNYVRQREVGRVRLIGSNENSRIRVSTSYQANFSQPFFAEGKNISRE